LLTTVTVGIASVLMIYYFFRRLAGTLFATIAVFATQYLRLLQFVV